MNDKKEEFLKRFIPTNINAEDKQKMLQVLDTIDFDKLQENDILITIKPNKDGNLVCETSS